LTHDAPGMPRPRDLAVTSVNPAARYGRCRIRTRRS
jgi:hypothetical protein